MDVMQTSVYETLVLVTDQFACERIIKAARVIANLSQTNLTVLSVMHSGAQANPEALEHLFKVAREYDARMTVEFSDNAQSAITHFIKENRVTSVVTGIPENENSMLVSLWKKLLNISFYTASEEGELCEVIDRKYQMNIMRAAGKPGWKTEKSGKLGVVCE